LPSGRLGSPGGQETLGVASATPSVFELFFEPGTGALPLPAAALVFEGVRAFEESVAMVRAGKMGLGICVTSWAAIMVGSVRADRDNSRDSTSPPDPGAVVRAMNALTPSDIAIDPAMSTSCPLDRLPASKAALVSLVPGPHRPLLTEGVRGRIRLRRGVKDLDLPGMVDDPEGRPEDAEIVREFFAGRPVDVAAGAGLTEGPYPLGFDWAVVLDPASHTLFSFVLNCRD